MKPGVGSSLSTTNDDDVFLDESFVVVGHHDNDKSRLLPDSVELGQQQHKHHVRHQIYVRQPQSSVVFSSRKQSNRNISLLMTMMFLSVVLMVFSWILLNPHGDASFGRKLGKWIQTFKESTNDSSIDLNDHHKMSAATNDSSSPSFVRH